MNIIKKLVLIVIFIAGIFGCSDAEADTMQETISATIILKISNYSTMKKFNQEYTITRLK